MPSELSQCITSEQWDEAIHICAAKPAMAKQKAVRAGFFEGLRTSEVMPIHEASCNERVPYTVVEALLTAYPESATLTESAYERLPLHIACRKTANFHVVRLLLDHYPDGCLQADVLGRLPIHYALSNGADPSLVSLLLQTRPNSARCSDRRGWTPLHVACSVGANTDIVQQLLQLYPESSILLTRKGATPRRCLSLQTASNKPHVTALLQKYEQQVDGNVRMPMHPQTSMENGIV